MFQIRQVNKLHYILRHYTKSGHQSVNAFNNTIKHFVTLPWYNVTAFTRESISATNPTHQRDYMSSWLTTKNHAPIISQLNAQYLTISNIAHCMVWSPGIRAVLFHSSTSSSCPKLANGYSHEHTILLRLLIGFGEVQ